MANLQLNLITTLGGFSSHRIRASSNGVPFSKPKSGGPLILDIPLDKIRRPLMRTRANDQEKVNDLMESIRKIGLQEPDSLVATASRLINGWGFLRFVAKSVEGRRKH